MVKDVQEETPFTVCLAKIVKGDVFLTVVTVKPFEFTALAEPVWPAEI